MLRLRQECPPETINTDQNEAHGKAIRALRACFKSSASSLGAFCGTQKASKDAPGGVEQRPLECPSRPLRGASGRGHRLLGQALKQPGELAASVERWQVKYLDNRLKADYGALKRVIDPTRGFKTLPTASATITRSCA